MELNKPTEKGCKVFHIKETAFWTLLIVCLKSTSSGFPSNVKTIQEKQRYICDYFEHEDKMIKNSGLRALAKLTFAMQTNCIITQFIMPWHFINL